MIADKKLPSVPGSLAVEISPPENSTTSFVDLVGQVLVWNDATPQEQIEQWRKEVRKLAKEPKPEFLSYFPDDKQEWRTKHVITWLAGCAPSLENKLFLYLTNEEISGSCFKDFIPERKPPIDFLFPGLTQVAYRTIREKLIENNLLRPASAIPMGSPGSGATASAGAVISEAVVVTTSASANTPLCYENVDPSHVLTIQRVDLCKEIWAALERCGVVLVRAPPMSGKTSLGTLFASWCSRNRPRESMIVAQFTFLWCSSIADSATPNDAFNRSFQSRAFDWQSESATGFLFEELCNATELPAGTVTVFVMDECQIAYNTKISLWPIVKATLAQAPMQRNCYFLLLAAYGEGRTTSGPAGTPVELAGCKSMSLSHIRLRTSEREEFFERLRNYPEAGAIYPVPDDVKRWISVLTKTHPGLFRRYVDLLVARFRPSSGDPPSAAEMLKFLNSTEPRQAIAASRAVPQLMAVTLEPLVKKLLLGPVLRSDLAANDLHSLILSGFIVHDDSGAVDFAAPVLRQILFEKLLQKSDAGTCTSAPDTLEECVMTALSKLHTRSLSVTWSTNLAGNRVCEIKWQHLFYHAMMDSVPADWIISPDFGHAVGSTGKLDFYITNSSGIAWGAELLVSGDRRKEHIDRFQKGGKYGQLIETGYLEHWLVLDFRAHKSPHPAAESWVWEAVYSDDYSTLAVYCAGQLLHQIGSLTAASEDLSLRCAAPFDKCNKRK